MPAPMATCVEAEYHMRACERNFSTFGAHCSLHQHAMNNGAGERRRAEVWKHFLDATNMHILVIPNLKNTYRYIRNKVEM